MKFFLLIGRDLTLALPSALAAKMLGKLFVMDLFLAVRALHRRELVTVSGYDCKIFPVTLTNRGQSLGWMLSSAGGMLPA